MQDKDHIYFHTTPLLLNRELIHIVNSHCDHITRPNTFDLRWNGSGGMSISWLCNLEKTVVFTLMWKQRNNSLAEKEETDCLTSTFISPLYCLVHKVKPAHTLNYSPLKQLFTCVYISECLGPSLRAGLECWGVSWDCLTALGVYFFMDVLSAGQQQWICPPFQGSRRPARHMLGELLTQSACLHLCLCGQI